MARAKPTVTTGNSIAQDGIQRLRDNFGAYIPAVHALPTGARAYPAAHHLVWAWALEDDSLGHTCIIAPPAHAKTNVVGVYYPCWWLGNNPNKHFVYVQAAADQAFKQSLAIRDTITGNARYRVVFPGMNPDKDKGWSQDRWYVKRSTQEDKDPTFKAVGVGGDLIGARADRLLLDDVNDQKNTLTDYQREKVNDWVATTAMSRLTPEGRAICIMTRWHESDLANWCESRGWTMVHMPAMSDGPEVHATIKRNGRVVGRILVHDRGPALWPEWMPISELDKKRIEVGPVRWASMYLGIPVPAGGALFHHDWWRSWNPGDLPPMVHTIQTWDTAFSEKATADYSVGQTWGFGINNKMYLLDQYRKRMDYPDLKLAIVKQYEKWKPSHIYIEERSSGQNAIQELRKDTALPIIGFKDQNRDKVQRAHATTGYWEAGQVYIPREDMYDWVGAFKQEMEFFPAGTHDDQVDAAVMGVSILSNHTVAAIEDDWDTMPPTIIGNVFDKKF